MHRIRARVFQIGNCQALRLPKRFHIDTSEVEIWREEDGLRIRPVPAPKFSNWQEMFEAIDRPKSDLS